MYVCGCMCVYEVLQYDVPYVVCYGTFAMPSILCFGLARVCLCVCVFLCVCVEAKGMSEYHISDTVYMYIYI